MQREFPRHLNSLAGLYEFTEEIMKAHDLPDGVRFPVHLAMEELFVNMVHYNPTVTTAIEVGIDVEDRVTVSLVDNGGVEFDVTTKRDVDIDAPLEERTPGGLGIHLIQNLVDSLEYQYQDGRGEVIFTKRSGN
ncbi:MAG: ATP-binding protein [Woeseiaceae bacterium]|jgi:anti-sigma regulatory factor (Ser/Thr protein kinase)